MKDDSDNRLVDEGLLFTEQEYITAFQLIMTDDEARESAVNLRIERDPSDAGPPWLLAPNVLDLLSLVSNDCAERVARILALSPGEALERRARVNAWLEKGPG